MIRNHHSSDPPLAPRLSSFRLQVLTGNRLVSLTTIGSGEALVHGLTEATTVKTRAARRQGRDGDEVLRTFLISLRVNQTPPARLVEGVTPYVIYRWKALVPTEESPGPPSFAYHPTVVRVPDSSEALFIGAVKAPQHKEEYTLEVWLDTVHDKREHSWSLIKITGESPSPRSHHAAVALAPNKDGAMERVAMFGGTSPKSLLVEDLLWMLKLKRHKTGLTGEWHRVQLESDDGVLPKPASRIAACSDGNGGIYVHGGLGLHNMPLNALWRIDFSSSYKRAKCHRVDVDSVGRSLPRASHGLYYVKRQSLLDAETSSDCLLVLGGTEPQCVEWYSMRGSRWYRSANSPDIIPPRGPLVPVDCSARIQTSDGRLTILHHSSSLAHLMTLRTRSPLTKSDIESSLDRLERFRSIAHLLHCYDATQSTKAFPGRESEIAVSPESAAHQLCSLGDRMGGRRFLFSASSGDLVVHSLDGGISTLEEVTALSPLVHELARSVTSSGLIVAVVLTEKELMFGVTSERLGQEIGEPVWATASTKGDQEDLAAVLGLIRQQAPRALDIPAFRALVSAHMAGLNRLASVVVIADAHPWLVSAVNDPASHSELVMRELSQKFEVDAALWRDVSRSSAVQVKDPFPLPSS